MKNNRRKRKYAVAVLSAAALAAALLGCASPVEETAEKTAASAAAEAAADAVDSESNAEAEAAAEARSKAQVGAGAETEKKEAAGELEVHFLDVGQGDATLIACDGHYMLIDAGNNDKGTLVQSYLEQQGVETLDYVIGTHPDADHIGGLDVILYKFDCGTVILPEVENDTRTYEDVIRVLEEKDYPVTAPVVGDTYTLGGASFTIIAPNGDYGDDLNDWSVGILLQNGENRFLFTGDAGELAEQDILANGIDISADVYKASHHGSNTASSEAFIQAVSPEYAVISVGEGNQYGHPHAEVLNRFREAGIKVFRTDEQGTIVAASDGTDITWNTASSESWQTGEAQGGGEVTVHITKTGETYHAAGCSYLSRSDIEITLSEAKERGLTPCSRCNPPQ